MIAARRRGQKCPVRPAVAGTESGLQAHPLILLYLFFFGLRSCPIPAHVFDICARFKNSPDAFSAIRN